MITVSKLMSAPVVTLANTESLSLAEEIMKSARLRHLPVVDEQDELIGLVTHRDILKASISTLTGVPSEEDKAFKRTVPVIEIMRTDIEAIAPDTSALDAALRLKQLKIGCLPVVEDKRLVGIITEADFLDLAIRLLETAPPVSHAPAPQQ